MSTDRTALGDRMKRFEAATRTTLPRRTYSLLRCDGRAFHQYLRGAERPYDEQFAADMDAVAVTLCQEIAGARLAYVQSDEITVLFTDFESAQTEPWFGGQVQKIVSIAAATATAALNARRPGKLAMFDARVFTIADPIEVANCFIWRQRDAVRNSVSMAAQSKFSPKQLHGVHSGDMQEMLWREHGINWNGYPDGFKRGRVVVKYGGERDVVYVDRRTQTEHSTVAYRTWWEAEPAPHFTLAPDGFLARVIPPMPTIAGLAA